MAPIRDVEGHCPMGCGPHLHLMPNGFIVCLAPDCPDKAAVHKILGDPETGHIVQLDEASWSAKHPLRERLDDELLSCGIERAVEVMQEVGLQGRYRVTYAGPLPGDWDWEPAGQEEQPNG
jgi:hypothetical protein